MATTSTPALNNSTVAARYRVTGMDCQSCVTKIEKAARTVGELTDVRVSLTSQSMAVTVADPTNSLPKVEQAVTSIGYQLDRIEQDELETQSRPLPPGYRRALWTVVALNGIYGVIEIVAGYVARSQALQADALDFLGDAAITFIGLVAIRWSMAWRAKAALLQGIFLGALGLGVLLTTIWRLFVQGHPEAEMMGVFGGIGLIINVTAAVVLLPHRTGDANVRAVWLFSRNDAIGNVAVVIAAALVAWSGTPWPDLAVAFVIAGLFIHSSWSIVQDATRELKELKSIAPPA